MIKKNYVAITINNKKLIDGLEIRNIDKAKAYIEREFYFNKLTCNVIVVARERNEINYNEHYHLLVETFDKEVDFENLGLKSHIWAKYLDNDYETLKYYEYIKKDGLYKQFEALDIDQVKTEEISWQELALKAKDNKVPLNEFLRKNPKLISKINMLKTFWMLD